MTAPVSADDRLGAVIATVGTAVLVTAVTVFAACVFASQWRAARAVIRRTQDEWDTPVRPEEETLHYSPEEVSVLAVLCRACQDGEGSCVLCVTECGSPACMGKFSDEDVEWLQSLSTPEGTDQ